MEPIKIWVYFAGKENVTILYELRVHINHFSLLAHTKRSVTPYSQSPNVLDLQACRERHGPKMQYPGKSWPDWIPTLSASNPVTNDPLVTIWVPFVSPVSHLKNGTKNVANGAVWKKLGANKIGTYLKAIAAKDNNVTFYVALTSSTTVSYTHLRDHETSLPLE